jgi:glycosyltransferase involved in cell wall biosynthesis
MGFGPLELLVMEYSDRFSNIHFQPAVKPSEVLHFTSSADIGLSVIENCCLSYYFSLPNKYFEYIMAEIPLVVSNFPDMANLVKMHDMGWVVDSTEESFVETVKVISRERMKVKLDNLKKIKAEFKWENEEHQYVKIFKNLELKF